MREDKITIKRKIEYASKMALKRHSAILKAQASNIDDNNVAFAIEKFCRIGSVSQVFTVAQSVIDYQ